jgi:DNA-binding MarR family transcriptional regulator
MRVRSVSIPGTREGDPVRLPERIYDMDPAEGGPDEGRIVLELSRNQVAMVLRAADAGGASATLLAGLDAAGRRASRSVDELLGLADADERRLSRSLLSGLLVLACFPLDGALLGIAELARRLDMSPSATHRYVSTLLAAELLERDPDSRRYRLARRHTLAAGQGRNGA